MSTKLKAGTATSGAVIDADTTGILEIQTGSTPTTAITIDGSQNVGIGTASPFGVTAGRTCASVNGASSVSLNIGTGGSQRAYLFSEGSIAQLGSIGTLPLTFAPNDTERMRIDSSGNLLVGTTSAYSANYKMSLACATGTGGLLVRAYDTTTNYPVGFQNSSGTTIGTISVTTSATAYNTSSDYRLKENIAPMKNALDVVQQLKPVTYNWKVDGSIGQGFIAHELAEIVPDAVSGKKDAINEDGTPKYQGIDTSFLVATLVAAIQELKAEVDALKGVK